MEPVTDEGCAEGENTEDEMPRDGRKGRRRQGLLTTSDITLNHFANSPKTHGCDRIKKSVVSATATAVVPTTVSANNLVEKQEDLSWFEKDLEDFVIEDLPGENEEKEEDLSSIGASGPAPKEKKQTRKEDDKGGLVYPVDFWYLIAEHIDPEDMGRFAGICRGCHSVTQTSAFWRKLYERHFDRGKEGLPNHVKPHNMEKLHGLRARVIRSLFILHSPLAARVQSRGPMEDEPYSLKGHRCLLAWHQPATKGWQFCFKFLKPSFQSWTSKPATKSDVYNGYNDLYYNPEEGCSVLQVTCCHFAAVDSVASLMGLLLNQVYVTLSPGFRHHRLRLLFDSRISTSSSMPSDKVVVLDDVVSLKLMQWWHPMYPFSS